MSQNLANRIANSISGKKRGQQVEEAEGATAPAAPASAPNIEFFKHDPNRQKAYAEGRKRLTTMDNKRKY